MAANAESCNRCSCAPIRAGVDRAFSEIARIAGEDDRTFNRDAVHRRMNDDVDLARPGEGGVNYRPYVQPEVGRPYALSTGSGTPMDTRENLRRQMAEGMQLVDDVRRVRPGVMPGLLPAGRRMGNGRQAANDAKKDLTRTGLPSELVVKQRYGRYAPREPRLWERERDVMTKGILSPYGVVPNVTLRDATGQSVPRGQQIRPAIDNFEAVDPGALYHRTAAVSRQAAYGAAGKYDLQSSMRDAYSFPGRYNSKTNTFCGPAGAARPAVTEGFFAAGSCAPCRGDEGMAGEQPRHKADAVSCDALCGGMMIAAAAYAVLRLRA